ncbi:TPA: hypothetical protein ACGJRP_003493 [Pseudomonas aeruginosa]|uniref:hypothetical protein n=1 Tax=Pseudomonas aeruginosa TaxID=287 RepID=UPI0012987C01|nr:hypothetical protein [Pseudomonas aeruginosa]
MNRHWTNAADRAMKILSGKPRFTEDEIRSLIYEFLIDTNSDLSYRAVHEILSGPIEARIYFFTCAISTMNRNGNISKKKNIKWSRQFALLINDEMKKL